MNTKYAELSASINELARLLTKNERLRRTELIRVLERTCSALEILSGEEALLGSFDPSGISHQESVTKDVRYFQDKFIGPESRALKDAGIDKRARDMLISRIRQLRKEMDVPKERNAAHQSRIKEARAFICGLLRTLKESDQDLQKKNKAEADLSRVLYLSGGALLVAVNVPLMAAEPVTANLSVAFGSGMIGKKL